jgi:hypothetical protein
MEAVERAKRWFAGLLAKQAEKQAEKEAAGWWSHFQEEVKEGKFNTYARVGGVANFAIIVFLSWTFFISLFPHSTLCLLVGVLVGFIELPFCCWCIPQCKTLSDILSPLKVYWMRGAGYIALAALLALSSGGSILMLLFAILLLLDGLCYVLAHFKGESELQDAAYDSLERGQGPSAPAPASTPARAAGKPRLAIISARFVFATMPICPLRLSATQRRTHPYVSLTSILSAPPADLTSPEDFKSHRTNRGWFSQAQPK